ncbi:MAG: cation diffusion facilitator family transporter, partial [Nanoarchaeota archaeon]|nr:cation diffusion facilitator family transporter [Nanoarchaeota archaeon]
FILKLVAGLISNSIAIISDAINSLTDVIASIVVFVCVRMGRKQADEDHPFGHHRIEPIAGLIVAILISLVGFEIIHVSIDRFVTRELVVFSFISASVLIFTMALKTFMAVYLRKVSKKINSPALFASSIDSRNDVFISATVLLGFIGYKLGYTYLDSVTGMIIGLWIIFSGYSVGKSNIDFLIGKSPDKKFMISIKEAALRVKGVKGLNDIRAHYVGSYFHVELHIEVNKNLSLKTAHDIGKKVEHEIESLPIVDKAFIHIDPV